MYFYLAGDFGMMEDAWSRNVKEFRRNCGTLKSWERQTYWTRIVSSSKDFLLQNHSPLDKDDFVFYDHERSHTTTAIFLYPYLHWPTLATLNTGATETLTSVDLLYSLVILFHFTICDVCLGQCDLTDLVQQCWDTGVNSKQRLHGWGW